MFNHLRTTYPIGAVVMCLKNDKAYKIAGYCVKNGAIVNSSITVKNREGVQFIYPASDLKVVR